MTPHEFLAAGERAQRAYNAEVNAIELRHERAVERVEAALQQRLQKLQQARRDALTKARTALAAKESDDYDALLASGHTYEEVRLLRDRTGP